MKYKISMSKDNFFKIHNKISCTDLTIVEDNAIFYVEDTVFNIIKDSKIPYSIIESLSMKIKRIISKYYLLMFGVFFLFSILYINTFRVNKIIFSIETPINDEIENTIKKSYRRLFMFDFTNINCNKLSMELQKKYIEYPYISVYQKNNNIIVDIYDELNTIKADTNLSGYLVAKKDSIVDSYFVYGGSLEVYKNKYVKKGDVLISNTIASGGVGLVLGYTYEKIELKINKKENIEELSGNNIKYQQLELFSNLININKDQSYKLYDYKEKVVFNLFDVFKIKEIEENEKSAIIKTYSEEEAIEIGKSIIIEAFNNNMISAREKIIDILHYNTTDNENSYSITYLVKKLESIGEFIEN